MALRKVHVSIPKDRQDGRELEEDFRRMECIGLLHKPWRVRMEGMVRKLITGEVTEEFFKTVRGQHEKWTPEL